MSVIMVGNRAWERGSVVWEEEYFDFPESKFGDIYGGKKKINFHIDNIILSRKFPEYWGIGFREYLFPRFGEEPFENREKAMEYICSEMPKYYHRKNIAVQYYSYTEGEREYKINELKRCICETEIEFNKFVSEHKISASNAEFIECSCCKSKLARKYISATNECPLCHKDLRSEATIKMLASYQDKLKELNKQLKEAENVPKKKGEPYWLVFCQYYVDVH